MEQYLREQRPPPPRVPAGWYPHPSMSATQCYWDGQRWTQHMAPMVGQPAAADFASTARLETWGWLGAFFFAPVGIVIGIILLTRPGRNSGGWILGVSAGWILLVWLVLSLSAQPTYY